MLKNLHCIRDWLQIIAQTNVVTETNLSSWIQRLPWRIRCFWHITLDRDIWTNIYQENLNINVHIRVYKAISYFLPSSECWIDFTCWRAVNLSQWCACAYNCYFTSPIPREQQCIAYTLNMLTSDEAMSTVWRGKGGLRGDSETRYLNDVLNLYHPLCEQYLVSPLPWEQTVKLTLDNYSTATLNSCHDVQRKVIVATSLLHRR